MRLHCYFCGMSVTVEMEPPSGMSEAECLRGIAVCPDCIKDGRIRVPGAGEKFWQHVREKWELV